MPLRETFYTEIIPQLKKDLNLKNDLRVPRPIKGVVQIGIGKLITTHPESKDKIIEDASYILSMMTGQKPKIVTARKSVAGFKLRKGMPIGLKVTLRGERMYAFLYKLINLALPRVRDFSGVSPNSFDGRGNYSLGLKEQLVFPEIEYDKIDRIRGMDITIVTTAKTDEEAKELLTLLGMPFKK